MGGGCTPTVELYKTTNFGQSQGIQGPNDHENEGKFAVLEGPTCFGGCYDFFCYTEFVVGKEAGMGNYAKITKLKPSGMCHTTLSRMTASLALCVNWVIPLSFSESLSGCCGDNGWCRACCSLSLSSCAACCC